MFCLQQIHAVRRILKNSTSQFSFFLNISVVVISLFEQVSFCLTKLSCCRREERHLQVTELIKRVLSVDKQKTAVSLVIISTKCLRLFSMVVLV